MTGRRDSAALPVVDVAPLTDGTSRSAADVAGQIQAACRDRGFFYVTGHGVPSGLLAELAAASAEFFALPLADKLEIAMERGGRAWRGYFPVGAELTSGQPDLKEGLYFGTELPDDDPRVAGGLALHGRNLFPRQVPRLRGLVLSYMDALTSLGQCVLAGVALPVDAASGPQRQRPHPAVVPVLPRSRVRRRSSAASRPRRHRTGRQAPVGRPGPACLHRYVRRLPSRQGVKGLPAAPARRPVTGAG